MARKALSQTKKAQIDQEKHDLLMARAVIRYQQELAKPDSEKRDGLQKVCQIVSDEYYRDTKQRVVLNYTTLQNLAKGGRTKA
ncbi:hypothetical protein H0H81_009971 [Sphagnurus paluster]|uniref:Uncharacterized protein n=1 Tax=Sphagnurus paluster TaxID=117069 RepID=A0A9P7K0Z5_9AGAR|nr:hypothetical protein H0H81_009971 [Sphagnurus paluster]